VPRPPGAAVNATCPELGTVAPSSDRHAMRSPGLSSVTSASHSTVWPAGALAVQCERPLPVTSTDSRWVMNVGRLAKSCQ
jgi:hypothetical protein